MSVWYRPHRGGLDESMRELQRVSSRADLQLQLQAHGWDEITSVDLYYDLPDTRINWAQTYVVMARLGDQRCVVGFTDGPLE